MALNDAGGDSFDNQIEDEDESIYPVPGVEPLYSEPMLFPGVMVGALDIQPDRGSGSYAEDGRLEVAEDIVMMNGEAQLGSAAMYGPTEIGAFPANMPDAQFFMSLYAALKQRDALTGQAAQSGEISEQAAEQFYTTDLQLAQLIDRTAQDRASGQAVDWTNFRRSLPPLATRMTGSFGSAINKSSTYIMNLVNSKIASQARQSSARPILHPTIRPTMRPHIGLMDNVDILEAQAQIGQYAQDGASEIGYDAPPDPNNPGYLIDGNPDPSYQTAPPDPNNPGYLIDGNPDPSYQQTAAQSRHSSRKAPQRKRRAEVPHFSRLSPMMTRRFSSVIGEGWAPGDGQSEIGQYAQDGASEIGYNPYALDGASEIGYNPYALDGASEIGLHQYAIDGAAEIGSAAMYGPTEIGTGWSPTSGEGGFIGTGWSPTSGEGGFVGQDIQEPFESFMMRDPRLGDWSPESQALIGAAAVAKVVEKARDNRQPPPPMRAVDVDSESDWPDHWSTSLTDVLVGAAQATGSPDPFPLTSKFMLRCGAGTEPRYVRVDTEASYKKYRQENSPEIQALHQKLREHMADPSAHDAVDEYDELNPNYVDPNDIVMLGAAVQAAEKEKEVELWMPKHFDGQVTAWREGDFVCSSMRIPGFNGEVRICTTLEPLQKCVDEMSRHAAESGAPASAVVGVLPEMGCVLGAGTGLKEMAAAAPSIAARPEMKTSAPFVVRIEPKLSPALCALAMLAMAVKENVPGASAEWTNLSTLSPGPVRQAMNEAVALAKAAEQ